MGSPNIVGYIAIVLIPFIAVAAFRMLRPAVAAASILLGSVLLLPFGIVFDTVGMPPLGGREIACISVVACLAILYPRRLRGVKPGRGIDLLILALFIGGVGTARTNGDMLEYGPTVIQAMPANDWISFALRDFIGIGLPFFIGRALFRTPREVRELCTVVVVAALLYSILAVFEIRMSPKLHEWIYGYSHSSYQYRFAGWRPVVFMPSGLALAQFFSVAVILATALARHGVRIRGYGARLPAGYLFVVLVLCRSFAALIYALVTVPVTAILKPRGQMRVAVLITLVAALYPVARAYHFFPTDAIVGMAEAVDTNRAVSLQFRFTNEDQLLEKALERPLFGWGGFKRSRVFDPVWGTDMSVTDGFWIITLGKRGIVGLLSNFGLLVIPVLVAWRRLGRVGPTAARGLVTALALVVAVSVVDLLPNGLFSFLPFLFSGALMGVAQGALARKSKRVQRRKGHVNMARALTGRRTSALATVSLSLLVAAPAGSEPSEADDAPGPDPIDVMVVTASRTPRPLSTTSTSVSVLLGEQVEAAHSEGLNDILRAMPGLYLSQPGGRGGPAELYMRGLDPNHVLVMVDGIWLNDPTNDRGGAFDPTTLSVLAIDRIEAVRGPISAAHGSGGLAGAVNIITRRTAPDEEPSFDLQGAGGRYATGHVRGRASAGVGFAGLSLAGSYDTNDAPGYPGGYRGGNLKATVDSTFPDGTDLRANVRFNDSLSEFFPVASGGPLFATIRDTEERDAQEVSAGLALDRRVADVVNLQLRVDHAQRWSDIESPGIAPSSPGGFDGIPATRSSTEYRRTRLAALANSGSIERLDVSLGGDVYWEKGFDSTLFDPSWPLAPSPNPTRFDLERTVGGVFVEGLYQLGWGVALNASIRADFPEGFDTKWSPSVGATLDLPDAPVPALGEWTIFGNWSQGFQLPSFYALGNAIVGNPSLRAEQSRGWEVGLRGQFLEGRVRTRVAYFDIDVENLIDFDFATFMLVNRSRVRSKGVEMEIEAELNDRLRIGGSATYNSIDVVGEDVELLNRPRWHGEIHVVGRPIESVELGLRVLFVGDAPGESIPTGPVTLESHTRTDITAAWQAHPHARVFLVVSNLFDKLYQEEVGFPAPGIYPRAGVELVF